MTADAFDRQDGPIKLLAPTTVASADEGATLIVEMTPEAFRALAVAVEVAFEDESSVPDEWRALAAAWWEFTHPQEVASG